MAELEPQEISQEEYNNRVTAWGSALGVKIRASIRSLTSKGKGDLLRSLRLKTGKWYGEVDKLAYHFVRHGVFVHKGVGRGYRMVGGRVMRVSGSASNQAVKDYARVKNRSFSPKVLTAASMERKAVEWFNPVVKNNIAGLADLVAEMSADRVVNASKILIR